MPTNPRHRVASIAGLTVLKLVAWADRGSANNKDAADLHRLLTTYANAGNFDRLYEEEPALLEAVGFDLELAGAQWLGRDSARICQPTTYALIRALLTSERLLERLVGQMVQTSAPSEASATMIVDNFCIGFLS